MASLRRKIAAASRVGSRPMKSIGKSCTNSIGRGMRSTCCRLRRSTTVLRGRRLSWLALRPRPISPTARQRRRWPIVTACGDGLPPALRPRVFGFLAGRALIPHRNGALLADLPAIHQQNVLPYVENVEFLRHLSAAVPPDQFVKDEPTLDRNLKELESANSPSFETRREWIQSLPPERKAELADRTRAFNDLEPASEEREHMRKVMEDIREDEGRCQVAKNARCLWAMVVAAHGCGTGTLLEQLRRLTRRQASGGRATAHRARRAVSRRAT